MSQPAVSPHKLPARGKAGDRNHNGQQKRPRLPDKFSAYANQADIQRNCQQRRYPDKEKQQRIGYGSLKKRVLAKCAEVIPSHEPRIVQAVREGVKDALNQRNQVKQSDTAQAGQQHPVFCPWMKGRFHSTPPSGRQMVRQDFFCQSLFRKPGIELHCSQNLSIVPLTFMIHNHKCFESICAD